MAVKHKVVECVEKKPECRLTIILRALQDISMQPGVQGIEMGRICESIVSSLGTVAVPTKTDEYLQFMENIKSVQEILANTCCSNENLIFTTLRAFYNDISNPKKQVQPTMSVVLQLIDAELIPKAVKWILNSGYSEQVGYSFITLLFFFLSGVSFFIFWKKILPLKRFFIIYIIFLCTLLVNFWKKQL